MRPPDVSYRRASVHRAKRSGCDRLGGSRAETTEQGFPYAESMITRRAFLRLSAGASVLGTGLYTWQIEPHWLEIVRRPLPISGLPSALLGKSLVQLSDLHVGPEVSDRYILDTFARVKALAPDLVVYTGDFTSFEPEVFAHAERIYADLPRGRLATLGILGNHDYGPNWAHPEVAARIADVLRARGVQTSATR